ncbi:MAG: UDP-N-acetylmuramoyl-L-alanyl-D-glutamate--2,6-diaminopimelate ligase [Xanthomonadaceae bacterium]|nr:UDP-N-acetylmuramoyl-L-alanyl-D-glutamate--2,6-diaminopimelate ligase [Xanthomonadaceae bacterium]
MKRLRELLEFGQSRSPAADVSITGFCMDSRRIEPGQAFIARAGTNGHGLDFAAEALRRGASVIVHDGRRQPDPGIAGQCLAMPDFDRNLVTLLRRFWDDPVASLDVLAVTGTNGKTSVAWLLAQALGGAMIGTIGIGRPGELAPATHTTPDLASLYRNLAAFRDAGITSVTIEASSHALVQQRLSGLAFTTAIFTNLGHDHLDYHASIEDYFEAKARLFRDYPSRRKLIGVDDPFGLRLAGQHSANSELLRYGLHRSMKPDVLGHIQRAGLDELVVDVQVSGMSMRCRSRLLGRINAYNVLVVAAELVARGHREPEVIEMIERLSPVPGRMSRIDGPAGQCVVIDYAHSPEALHNALAALRELTPERLICVFGCGGDRDRAKRPRMGRIAESMADAVIVTDDNPRGEHSLKILREIQAGMARPDRARVIPDRRQAIADAIAQARPGDCVLVAGKGHERTQTIGGKTFEFSDFDAVRDALTEAA